MLIRIRDIQNIDNIQDIIAQHAGDYEYVGIRIQEMPSEVGKELTHNSHVWDDGEDTGEEIDGVCAIDPKQIQYLSRMEINMGYFGEYILIIGSDYAQHGADPAEIIMKKPTVLACIDLSTLGK